MYERAAKTPLPVLLIVTHGARSLPPSGSTAGSALVLCNPYMVYTINRKQWFTRLVFFKWG